MSYAHGTSVSVDRSMSEIKRTLDRFGAEKFGYFSELGAAAIAFQHKGRAVRMRLRLPVPDDFVRTETNRTRTPRARDEECDRETRRRWRSLALVIKAKLAAIEDGIATFEDEWLAYLVLPGGKTVGEKLVPQLEAALSTDGSPARLLGLGDE